jgi:hypothetical protein
MYMRVKRLQGGFSVWSISKEEESKMYHLNRVAGTRIAGIVVVLALLLAVFVNPAQASETTPVSSTGDGQPQEAGGLVCLALVGGAALLAAGMLLGKLRSMLS